MTVHTNKKLFASSLPSLSEKYRHNLKLKHLQVQTQTSDPVCPDCLSDPFCLARSEAFDEKVLAKKGILVFVPHVCLN